MNQPKPRPKALSPQDLDDLLTGAALLGSGGGGPRSVGQAIIESLVKQGKTPLLACADDIGDRETMAVSAFAGAPTQAAGTGFDWSPATQAFQALDIMVEARRRFDYVLPGEVGGGNSFIPIAVACSLPQAIPVVDAAGARRAIPQLAQVTYASHEVPISPIVLGDGKRTMSMSVADPITAGNVLHGVIGEQGFGQLAGIAMWAMDGLAMKASAVTGTTTYALELGRTIRAARAAGKAAWQAAVTYLDGWELFHGKVVSANETTTGGFDVGVVLLQNDQGEQLRIYNQNENLIAWSSARARPIAMAPDLICFITDDGVPFSNADPEMVAGTPIHVLGARSIPQLRVPYIVDQFLATLRSIGYGGPYVPIEDLVGT